MARKNIFDIMSSQWDLETEANRIHRLFTRDKYLGFCEDDFLDSRYKYITLEDFVDQYSFSSWKNRTRCIDVEDYLNTLDYYQVLEDSYSYHEDFLVLIEIVYNFWMMAERSLAVDDTRFNVGDDFFHLKNLMESNLSHYNHKAVYIKETEQLIIIEDKPEVTAVAEIVQPELSSDLLRYNHYSLRGNIATKKAILNHMGHALEPKRKELNSTNPCLEDNVFYLLNNMNIRHNNRKKGTKYYKGYVAEMRDEDMETWYDETYQMILLAFLELDQIERNSRCKNLRTDIENAKIAND